MLPMSLEANPQNQMINLFSSSKSKHIIPSSTPQIKISLPELLKEATPQEGVHWIEPGKCFEINWELFVPFYRKKRRSNAKLQNIQKRFKRAKNGCTRIVNKGFNATYLFSEPYPRDIATPSLEEKDSLSCWFKKQTEVDLITVAEELLACSNSLYDSPNMLNLLFSDVIEKKANRTISKDEFDCFLNRFGPLEDVIYKMRDFINSGANDWYHGNISRETSESRLKEHLKTNQNTSAFLIRAKSTPGSPVAFVISSGFSTTTSSPPQIFHTQIFSIKNKLFTVIKEKNIESEQDLSSVIGILDYLNPRPVFPLPSNFLFWVEDRPSNLPIVSQKFIMFGDK